MYFKETCNLHLCMQKYDLSYLHNYVTCNIQYKYKLNIKVRMVIVNICMLHFIIMHFIIMSCWQTCLAILRSNFFFCMNWTGNILSNMPPYIRFKHLSTSAVWLFLALYLQWTHSNWANFVFVFALLHISKRKSLIIQIWIMNLMSNLTPVKYVSHWADFVFVFALLHISKRKSLIIQIWIMESNV